MKYFYIVARNPSGDEVVLFGNYQKRAYVQPFVYVLNKKSSQVQLFDIAWELPLLKSIDMFSEVSSGKGVEHLNFDKIGQAHRLLIRFREECLKNYHFNLEGEIQKARDAFIFNRQCILTPTAAGLEEREVRHKTSRIPRIAIQELLQTVLRDLTQFGFTYQIIDQSLVESYPELAVLSELHPGIRIDRSQNQEETNQLVVDLVARGIRWVDHYGESDRASRFRTAAQNALIDVRVPRVTELELLKQILANLSGFNNPDLLEARLERMGLSFQKIASWLEGFA